MNYSTIVGSTIRTNNVSVNTSQINITTYGTTVATNSISNTNNSFIRTSDIKAELDASPDNQQIYTFGPSVQERWIVGGCGNTLGYCNDGINWTNLTTTIFGGTTAGVGYGFAWSGSIWVGAGNPNGNGTVTLAYSYDGITWVGLGSTIFTGSAAGVVWAGNKFVAIGYGTNSSAYSYDGINWIPNTASTNIFTSPNGIAWNGSRFVVGSSAGNFLAYSNDGITWYASTNGNSIFTGNVNFAAWNGIRWVATGLGTNSLAYSADGITWTGSANGNSIFSTRGGGVGWNGKIWVAGGQGTNSLGYSTDGINWVASANGNSVLGAQSLGNPTWNGTRWVATGQNAIAYSSDGITWAAGTNFFTNYSCYSAFNALRPHKITFPANRIVAGSTGPNTMVYSSDGINWSGAGSPFGASGNGVAWNGVTWVAVGQCITNTINCSYDGITWSGLGTTIFTTAGYNVAWGNNQWIAVGAGTNTIAYSNDGFSWIGLGMIFGATGYGLAWNGSLWVACGQCVTNTLVYSTNGISWTSNGTSIFTTAGNAVCWSGSRFVGVGVGTNTIAWSNDGITWNGLGSSIFSVAGFAVAWNGQRFVAVGQGTNSIAYSADGINWIGVGTSNFSVCGNGITWNNNRWIAVGQGINKQSYSADGIVWTDTTPYAYLPMEGTTGDVVGNATVTLTGSTYSYVTGKVGQYAINLNNSPGTNASNYIRGTWTAPANYTITGWFNVQSIGTGYQVIFSAMNGYIILGLYTGTFAIYAQMAQNASTTYTFNTGITPSLNTWYSFSMNFQTNGPCSFYLNNNLIGSYTNSGGYQSAATNSGYFGLGTFDISGNTSQSTNIYVDDFRIYTGAYTSPPYNSVVTNNYNAPYIYLPFENSVKDAMGVSIVTQTGSVSYVTGQVGITAVNLANTAGNAPSNYLYYTMPALTTFSVTGWFNLQSLPTSGNVSSIFCIGSSTQTFFQIQYYNNVTMTGTWTGLYFWFYNSTNVITPIGFQASISTNTWYNFTTVFQASGTCYAYLNGTLLGTVAGAALLGTPSRIAISSSAHAAAQALNGYVDDIRIYPTAITTTQPTVATNPIYGSSLAWNGSLTSGPLPNVFIQHPTIALGAGAQNSIAYSPDGVTYTGLGTSVFTQGQSACWNGSKWLALGSGANTMAYSLDGLQWNGLGTVTFGYSGLSAAWNGSKFTAVGTPYYPVTGGLNGTTYTVNFTPSTGVTSYTANLYSQAAYTVSALVVGGGGGGGADQAGGGGAGGVLANNSLTLVPGTTYIVSVGRGGYSGSGTAPAQGINGGNSTFGSLIAYGGGGGAGGDGGGGSILMNGLNGGSGGGGATRSAAAGGAVGTAGTGVTGQGYAGGIGSTDNFNYQAAGGGGGAGGVGGNGTGPSPNQAAGAGGIGVTTTLITTSQATTYGVGQVVSTSVYFGGGGGGGVNRNAAGVGGSGGGGTGSYQANINGTSGTPNTGGGGGGGLNYAGGNGGSGCVILSVPTTYYSGIQTGATVITNGANTVLIWKSGYGSYTALPASTFVSSATGTTSPITFTGLTAGTSYYATVQPTTTVGNNTLAYSTDGVTWTGLGTSTFTAGTVTAWNGSQWLAGGSANGLVANTLAYSSDGITWTGLGTTVFAVQCNALLYGQGVWLAGGQGVNSLMYSANGTSWNAAASPAPPASPYVLLSFNGVATDSGSAGITPTTTGAVIYNNQINITGSQCIDFTSNTGNGAASLYITYPLSLSMTTGYTIMFWMRPVTLTYTGSNRGTIFSLTNGTPSTTLGYQFDLYNNGNIWTDVAGTGFYIQNLAATNLYSYNTWNHVAITFSGAVNTVFINGVQVASGSLGAYSTTYLTIASGAQNIFSYKGYLNDFRIYNGTILTATQIAAAAQLGSGTTIFSLCNSIAWSGTTFVATGYGNNTLAYSYNGISWVGLGNTMFSTSGISVAWNGSRFVASGAGITMAYSPDGIKWYSALPNPILYLPFENSYLDVMGNSAVTLTGTAAYVPGANTYVSPQQTGLAGYSWTQQGVSWITSTSGSLAGGYSPFYLFNNTPASSANRWVNTLQNYTSSTNTATATTTVTGLGSIGGDWIQLQASLPLVLNSYMYATSGVSLVRNPQSFYIVGSNDGTTWYPVHYCVSMSANPFSGAVPATPAAYIMVGYTGTQTFTGNVAVTGSFTAYSTTTNPYTYFRMIFRTNFASSGDYIDFSGLYYNFTPAPNTILYTNPTTAFVSPQQTSLASNTWTQSGITYTGTASSVQPGAYYIYNAFNTTLSASNTWMCNGTPYNGSGVYNNTYSTTIIGVGSYAGEWLQIQTSIPVIMNSYTFGSGQYVNFPKTYYIVGSNDGTNWYPMQSASVTTTPFSTNSGNYLPGSGYIVVNSTSAQYIYGNVIGSISTTAQAYATTAYTYFRIITQTNFTGSQVEIGEWYINFSTTATLLSNSQIVYNPTPSYAINFVNTAGGTPTNFISCTLPSLTNYTVSGWFNVQSFATNSQPQVIFSTVSQTNVMYINQTSNTLGVNYNGSVLGTSSTLSLNTWYNFVVIFQSSGLCAYYLNGSLIGSGTAGAGFTATRIVLGSSDISSSIAFNGYIDDFKVYNYAVNPSLLFTQGNGIATNSRVGATIVDSQIALNKNVYPYTTKLDIVSDTYYQNGFTNCSVAVSSHNQ